MFTSYMAGEACILKGRAYQLMGKYDDAFFYFELAYTQETKCIVAKWFEQASEEQAKVDQEAKGDYQKMWKGLAQSLAMLSSNVASLQH